MHDLLVLLRLLGVQGRLDRLGEDRFLAEEPRVEGGLQRLDLLPDLLRTGSGSYVLVLGELLPHLLDPIEEPLDVAAAGQQELLLLDGGQAAGPLQVVDVERQERIELVAGHAGVGHAHVAEDPLVELGVVDDEAVHPVRPAGRRLVLFFVVLGPGGRPGADDRQEHAATVSSRPIGRASPVMTNLLDRSNTIVSPTRPDSRGAGLLLRHGLLFRRCRRLLPLFRRRPSPMTFV